MAYIRGSNKTLRQCSKCEKILALEHFHKRSGTLYHSKCKECKNAQFHEYHKEYWHKGYNKKHRQTTIMSQARKMQRYFQWLSQQVCVDCGCNDPILLEFDHREPGLKSYTISHKRKRYDFKRLLIEIAKCDCVCRNCHKIRTYNRFFHVKQGVVEKRRASENVHQM